MKDELFKKVYIHSVDDLPKETGDYFVKLYNGSGRILHLPFEGEVGFNVWKVFEYYLQPLSDQDLPSDEEIEEWIKADANWSKTFINGAIYGAKAMRDGWIKSNRK
jgi:hypothetical protein